jgi:hypothetical protein
MPNGGPGKKFKKSTLSHRHMIGVQVGPRFRDATPDPPKVSL